jgi:hypothetical protein
MLLMGKMAKIGLKIEKKKRKWLVRLHMALRKFFSFVAGEMGPLWTVVLDNNVRVEPDLNSDPYSTQNIMRRYNAGDFSYYWDKPFDESSFESNDFVEVRPPTRKKCSSFIALREKTSSSYVDLSILSKEQKSNQNQLSNLIDRISCFEDTKMIFSMFEMKTCKNGLNATSFFEGEIEIVDCKFSDGQDVGYKYLFFKNRLIVYAYLSSTISYSYIFIRDGNSIIEVTSRSKNAYGLQPQISITNYISLYQNALRQIDRYL